MQKPWGGVSFWLRVAGLVTGLLFWTLADAQIDVLDRIDITPGQDRSEIHIHLNVPVRYKSHAPRDAGDVLRINVEPVATLGAENDVLFANESLQWSPGETVPLYEVVYNSAGISTATVTLQFARETSYEVPPAPDPRSLTVIVYHPAAAHGPAAPGQAFPYAINLASSTQPFSAETLPGVAGLLAYRVYTMRFIKDGMTWNRLRLGFFTSRQEAETVLHELQPYFPGAWVTPVGADERAASAQNELRPSAQPQAVQPPAAAQVQPSIPVPAAAPAGAVSGDEVDRINELMEQASATMTDKDYDAAIRLYTKILEYPEHAFSRQALEFLGLARERKGQAAQAKAVYDSYLARYPEGEDAARVRQRRNALVTAAAVPKGRLAVSGSRERSATRWDIFGGFSQFYRRDQNTTQVNDDKSVSALTQSSLSNDLDITGRMLSGDNDLRTRVTGGYLHDFLNNGDDSQTTLSALYFDAQNRQRRLGMRLGRQSRSTGGVLGRFDGLLLELPVTHVIRIAINGGYPVASAHDAFDASRVFYGGSLLFDGFAQGWDANTFYIEQQVDGIADRRAVGGELRYFDPQRSFFSLVDYDVLYNALNTVQLLGSLTAADRTTVNLLLDYRNSPILTTSNALQGQSVTRIEDLLASFTEPEIQDLARDRTPVNRLATLGVTRPLSERLQLTGDITWSRLADTPASGGVAAVPGTDNEYYYNVQLIGSDLIKPGDLTVLGMRYGDATTTRIISLSLDTRYPVTTEFRVNPRLRIDFRHNTTDNTDQYIYRPSARLTWNVRRRFRLETEFGGEWSDRELVTGTTATTSYFATLGYRADF